MGRPIIISRDNFIITGHEHIAATEQLHVNKFHIEEMEHLHG